jgi:amino acid permease
MPTSSLSLEGRRQPSNYEEVPDHSELGKGFVRRMYDGGSDQQEEAEDYDYGDGSSVSRSYEDDDDDDDDDPSKTTAAQSFLHLVKGYVGPGCLSLPWAFSRLGILPATVACFFLGYWSSYNCWSVVRLKRRINNNLHSTAMAAATATARSTDDGVFRVMEEPYDAPRGSLATNVTAATTYPDVAGALAGDKAKTFTKYSICVQQLSICTVFLSFVGTNLNAVLSSVVGWNVSHATVLTLALPAVIALSCLPNLKALAPITALGTALLFVGFAFLAAVVAVEWPNRRENYDGPEEEDQGPSYFSGHTRDWKDAPLALCALLYSFEGICLILPVESSMLRPNKFFPIFAAAMASSATIFSVLAGMSVSTFGNVTNGSITAFLLAKYGNGNSHLVRSLVLAANAAVSLSVLVTFPLQLFPCLELLLPSATTSSDFRSLPSGPDDPHSRDQASPARVDTAADEIGNRSAQAPADSPANVDRPVRSSALEIRGRSFLSEEGEEAGGSPRASRRDGVWRGVSRLWEADDPSTWAESAAPAFRLRIGLVLLTYVVAVAVPNVQSLISLAGALAGSSTALLIPPALELAGLRQHREQQQPWGVLFPLGGSHQWAVRRCYLLLLGGFIFMLIGTVASIADILRTYTSPA